MAIIGRILIVSVLTGAAWAVWVHMESRPKLLVTESALQSYSIALAELGLQESPFVSRPMTKGLSWDALTPEQKDLLAPLERRWEYLSSDQKRSVLHAARSYAKLEDSDRARLASRLKQWTDLTDRERKLLRERYKLLAALPPERQAQVRRCLTKAVVCPHF